MTAGPKDNIEWISMMMANRAKRIAETWLTRPDETWQEALSRGAVAGNRDAAALLDFLMPNRQVHAERAVVTAERPGRPIRLSLYDRGGIIGCIDMTPAQALWLANDLLACATPEISDRSAPGSNMAPPTPSAAE